MVLRIKSELKLFFDEFFGGYTVIRLKGYKVNSWRQRRHVDTFWRKRIYSFVYFFTWNIIDYYFL